MQRTTLSRLRVVCMPIIVARLCSGGSRAHIASHSGLSQLTASVSALILKIQKGFSKVKKPRSKDDRLSEPLKDLVDVFTNVLKAELFCSRGRDKDSPLPAHKSGRDT